MKRFTGTYLLLAVLALASCKAKRSEMIIGSWKISNIVLPVPSEIPDSDKKRFADEMQMQVEEMKKTSSYEFFPDGTFNYKMMGHDNKGNWKFTTDETKLILSKDSRSDTTKVLELTKEKFVLEVKEKDEKELITLIK
jgi:hypothetical protein